jgi:P27 family predicted phage terminase small subunit
MGSRGPLPKSAGERELGGNAGKRDKFKNARANPGEPLASIECPKELKGLAREFWNKYVPMLQKRGWLTAMDEPSLRMMCQLWEDYHDYRAVAKKQGEYYTTTNGSIVPHPASKQATTALNKCNDLLKLFGMHPSSRVRLGPAQNEPEKDDEYKQFRRA